MEEKFQLRSVYNRRVIALLAMRIKAVYPAFDDNGFCNGIYHQLDDLSYGERAALIREQLEKFLPDDFPKAATILIDSLGPELTIEPGKTDWDGFIIIPLSEYIANNGLEHYDLSMKALYEMTKRFTAENAIRAFIRYYPEKTLKHFETWTQDNNVHVRRLVSEGSRPRLPLAAPLNAFKKDPRPVIALLERLKDDPELYVRRSVANNLNDIAKDNPDIVVMTLKKWKNKASEARLWLIKHALRTLFKRGYKDAFELMGFFKPEIAAINISLDRKTINIGETAVVHLEFRSLKPQQLMIDYAVHYMKSNGKQAKKVFKMTLRDAGKEEPVKLSRKHSFKQMTTRTHYPGAHSIEPIINGYSFPKRDFMVKQ